MPDDRKVTYRAPNRIGPEKGGSRNRVTPRTVSIGPPAASGVLQAITTPTSIGGVTGGG